MSTFDLLRKSCAAFGWLMIAACGVDDAGKRASDVDASLTGSSGTNTGSSSTASTSTNSTASTSASTNSTASTSGASSGTNTTSAATGGAGAGGATGAGGGAGTGNGGSGTGGSGTAGGDAGPRGGPCGYKNLGQILDVSPNIELCLPPEACAPDTCPPQLGSCVAGKCVYKPGYNGVATLPEAWATYYCDLGAGACNGVYYVPGGETPLGVAQRVGQELSHPLCTASSTGTCVGITALAPMMEGNSQLAKDPATGWGQGLSWASGLCYEVTGPGGTAVLVVTDRCAGFCSCKNKIDTHCVDCIGDQALTLTCPCVGSAPPAYSNCCGRTCGGGTTTCDWCASNNHAHFDVDNSTYQHLCADASLMYGSCKLTSARFIPCASAKLAAWPPP